MLFLFYAAALCRITSWLSGLPIGPLQPSAYTQDCPASQWRY
jgi:hypothetical protein